MQDAHGCVCTCMCIGVGVHVSVCIHVNAYVYMYILLLMGHLRRPFYARTHIYFSLVYIQNLSLSVTTVFLLLALCHVDTITTLIQSEQLDVYFQTRVKSSGNRDQQTLTHFTVLCSLFLRSEII